MEPCAEEEEYLCVCVCVWMNVSGDWAEDEKGKQQRSEKRIDGIITKAPESVSWWVWLLSLWWSIDGGINSLATWKKLQECS